MFFYWLLFFVVLLIACSKFPNKGKTIFTILFILAIFRSGQVGNDLKEGYMYFFQNVSFNRDSWDAHVERNELGFIYMTAFFKQYIVDNYLVYYNMLLGVMLVFFYKFLKKYSVDTAFSLFCLLAFAYYFECFNGMRQQWCTSLLVSATPLIYAVDKNFKYSHRNVLLFTAITIVACLFFHKALLIYLLVIPCFMFYQRRFCDTPYLQIYLTLAFVLSIPIARYASAQFAALAYLFENDTSNIGGYMSIGVGDSFGEYSIVSNGINTLFCMLCVYFHRYKKSPFLVIYVLGLLILDPLTQIYWIYQRMAYVFMFFRIIVYAELWHNIPKNNEKLLYRVFLIIYAFLMFSRRLINDNFEDVVPYDTFLFPGLFNF